MKEGAAGTLGGDTEPGLMDGPPMDGAETEGAENEGAAMGMPPEKESLPCGAPPTTGPAGV